MRPDSVSDRAIRGDGNLEQGDQLPPTRLGFNSRCHDRLSSVREDDNVTGLDVRGRVLEEAEIIAGGVVKAVDRHRHSVSSPSFAAPPAVDCAGVPPSQEENDGENSRSGIAMSPR